MKEAYIIKTGNGEYLQGLRSSGLPDVDDDQEISVITTKHLRIAKKFNLEYATIVCFGLHLYAENMGYEIIAYSKESGEEKPRYRGKVIDITTRKELPL